MGRKRSIREYQTNRVHRLGMMGLAVVISSACALKGARDPDRKTEKPPVTGRWDPGPAPETGFDFIKDCGIELEGNDDDIVFSQKFRSLNIVMEGSVALLRLNYRVEAAATLDLSSARTKSSSNTVLKINSAKNMSTGGTAMGDALIKIGADATSKMKTGILENIYLPSGEWLKLTNGSNPVFKDLLCVVNGKKSVKWIRDKKETSLVFSPAFANTISPLASPERFKTELGTGRVLQVEGKIDRPNARPVKGIITFKPVATTAQFTDALTGAVTRVSADAAWEVVSDFTKGGADFAQVNSVTTFYVNHAKKRFVAITQKDLDTGSAAAKPKPLVVMIPVD